MTTYGPNVGCGLPPGRRAAFSKGLSGGGGLSRMSSATSTPGSWASECLSLEVGDLGAILKHAPHLSAYTNEQV